MARRGLNARGPRGAANHSGRTELHGQRHPRTVSASATAAEPAVVATVVAATTTPDAPAVAATVTDAAQHSKPARVAQPSSQPHSGAAQQP